MPMGPQGLAQLHAGAYRLPGASILPSITLGCLWAIGATAYKEAELGTHSSGLEYHFRECDKFCRRLLLSAPQAMFYKINCLVSSIKCGSV